MAIPIVFNIMFNPKIPDSSSTLNFDLGGLITVDMVNAELRVMAISRYYLFVRSPSKGLAHL
jgi:hypothetical protein